MKTSRQLLYPEPYLGQIFPISLTSDLRKVYEFGTAIPVAHRIPLLFSAPARILIKIESVIGSEKGWIRAGSLAQVLYGLPGEPKKTVKRLYLDELFVELDGSNYAYYLEFWSLRWVTDYYIEVWAQKL